MNLEQISSIISKLHPGASYVVVYKTAASTVNGEAAFKITHKPCRLGVRYSHLKHMLGHKSQALPGNGKWVIDKYVYEDTNGYKLRITNGAFGKPTSTYVDASNNSIDPQCIVRKAPKSFIPIVQCICLENVIAIMKKGKKL